MTIFEVFLQYYKKFIKLILFFWNKIISSEYFEAFLWSGIFFIIITIIWILFKLFRINLYFVEVSEDRKTITVHTDYSYFHIYWDNFKWKMQQLIFSEDYTFFITVRLCLGLIFIILWILFFKIKNKRNMLQMVLPYDCRSLRWGSNPPYSLYF